MQKRKNENGEKVTSSNHEKVKTVKRCQRQKVTRWKDGKGEKVESEIVRTWKL
jgi:hypothetical protein